MKRTIPFNKPCVLDDGLSFISNALDNQKLCGNGQFTQKCQSFFEDTYGFKKTLLTTSCTDALEMAAMLCDIKHGDEVIIPSYTFVSTALAFVRQGAKIVFADSEKDTPNLDVDKLEMLITDKTVAIVPVHYAGVSVDMDKLMHLAEKHNLWVIEDAAQAIDATYKGQPLGKFGHLACFSFHETKNITAGEGGLLVVNDDRLLRRSEIIWEKGTNRSEFFRGEVNKYGWVDTGSSFLPSELNAAFLYSQLIHIEEIQKKRITLWQRYYDNLNIEDVVDKIKLPYIPPYASNNAHMFYLVCKTGNLRTELINYLKEHNVHATFHYLCLHDSEFSRKQNWISSDIINAVRYSDCLVRLPLFYDLSLKDVDYISKLIINFLNKNE